MRLDPLSSIHASSFAGGLALGLGLALATYAVVRASRRRSFDVDLSKVFIDGAKPLDPVARTLAPPDEVTSPSAARVEGELGDPPVNSQRW